MAASGGDGDPNPGDDGDDGDDDCCGEEGGESEGEEEDDPIIDPVNKPKVLCFFSMTCIFMSFYKTNLRVHLWFGGA